jgi:hypothetical protein
MPYAPVRSDRKLDRRRHNYDDDYYYYLKGGSSSKFNITIYISIRVCSVIDQYLFLKMAVFWVVAPCSLY